MAEGELHGSGLGWADRYRGLAWQKITGSHLVVDQAQKRVTGGGGRGLEHPKRTENEGKHSKT